MVFYTKHINFLEKIIPMSVQTFETKTLLGQISQNHIKYFIFWPQAKENVCRKF